VELLLKPPEYRRTWVAVLGTCYHEEPRVETAGSRPWPPFPSARGGRRHDGEGHPHSFSPHSRGPRSHHQCASSSPHAAPAPGTPNGENFVYTNIKQSLTILKVRFIFYLKVNEFQKNIIKIDLSLKNGKDYKLAVLQLVCTIFSSKMRQSSLKRGRKEVFSV
jgi:hypothetical protein